MNSTAKPAYGHPATASEFLIHHTESTPISETGETSLLPGWSVAAAAKPEILTATDLKRRITTWKKLPDRFAILVARMDVEKNTTPDALEQELAETVAKTTSAMAEFMTGSRLLAYVAPGEFALLIPDIGPDESEAIGENIRNTVSSLTSHTVTLGIAHYPALTYSPAEILTNARKAVDHAVFFGPGSQASFDAVTLNISGDQCYQAGDVDLAITEYEKGLTLDAGNVNLHNSIGVCFGIRKDFASALKHFETALEIDSAETMAVYNIGMVFQLQNQTDPARTQFEKALSMTPDLFEARFQLARIEVEAGHFEAARDHVEKLVSQRPESASAHRLKGHVESHDGNLAEAIFHYKKAIKINPDDAAALGALGKLFEATNESRDIALVFCEQSVRISPEDGEMQFFLGQMYVKHGRLEDAAAAFRKAKTLGVTADKELAEIEARMAGDKAS